MLGITMKLGIIISYTILATALSGCLPNAVTYYQPSVDGGQLRAGRCVPTKSLVDFTVRNSREYMPIRAFADNGPYVNQVALFFSKGSWERFRFSSTDFWIYDLDKKITIRPSSIRAYSETGFRPLTTEPYSLKDGRLPVSEIQITLTERLPANFELLSPSIVIDDEEIEFPTIHFERKVWVGISPFNCWRSGDNGHRRSCSQGICYSTCHFSYTSQMSYSKSVNYKTNILPLIFSDNPT